jgi:hypothetical protein
MENLIVSAAVGCVALIGLLRLVMGLRNVSEKRDFATSFLMKLQEYVKSDGRETDTYGWILNHSNKMQNQMGYQGVYAHYRPPFQNYFVSNYPVIINMVPELRRALEDRLLSNRLANQYFNALQEAIIRHIGSADDIIKEITRELKNPFIWLREGVRAIIAIPVSLLVWFGLITDSVADKIKTSILFKIFAGSVATIGFISAIVTIALGWNDFLEKIKSILP